MGRKAQRPREDYGFFGPGSPTWRVWTHPAAFIGFQRAVTIETLDPFLTAAVNSLRGVYTNPARRFERTTQYFLTIAVGDGRSAVEASEVLLRVHARAVGTEPVSGLPFAANDPDSQLWIHVTAWHSILRCYEQFGPGPLAPEDEARYWQECAIAAELQTIDVRKVPRSRAEVHAYFTEQRPRLALTVEGRDLFHYFLRPRYNPKARALTLTWRTTTLATIATMPRWMRALAGLHRSRVLDVVATISTRIVIGALSRPSTTLHALRVLAPAAHPVLAEARHGAEPLEPRTVTPSEARARLAASRGAAAAGAADRSPSGPDRDADADEALATTA